MLTEPCQIDSYITHGGGGGGGGQFPALPVPKPGTGFSWFTGRTRGWEVRQVGRRGTLEGGTSFHARGSGWLQTFSSNLGRQRKGLAGPHVSV